MLMESHFLIHAATEDYIITSSDLTFDAATSSQTVTIPILDDDIVEDSEAIIVTLTSSDPAAIVYPQSASVTIEDNDGKQLTWYVLKTYLTPNKFTVKWD